MQTQGFRRFSPTSSLAQFYEIERILTTIKKGNFFNIALQLPDELLSDSWDLIQALEEVTDSSEFECSFFIMGDTSYGACCIDEVNAQHIGADLIVHFGHSCLSKTTALTPVLFVFCQYQLDLEKVKSSIQEVQQLINEKKKLRVYYDCIYDHILSGFQIKDVEIQKIPAYFKSLTRKEDTLKESAYASVTENEEIIYIGQENEQFHYIALRYSHLPKIFRINNKGEVCERSNNSQTFINGRYSLVMKARDQAQVFGIIMSTLSCGDYSQIHKLVKKLIKSNDKKFYTLYVGRINPAKLANFTDIDMFVVISCPQKSLGFDHREFLKPILTPHELQLALDDSCQFTGHLNADYSQILPKDKMQAKSQTSTQKSSSSSLAHGDDILDQLTTQPTFGTTHDPEDPETQFKRNSLILKNNNNALSTVFGDEMLERVEARAFKGLDIFQEKEVRKPMAGRKGIASHYEDL